jgi:putative membrane protein
MQFLKTLFWVAVAVTMVLFASVNWEPVTIRLWGGLEADVKLPVLVLAAFLLGFLPMLAVHRARMWSLKRRIENFERQAALSHPVHGVSASTGAHAKPAAEPAPASDPNLTPSI